MEQVVVIGGGPAGIFAAIAASRHGCKVVLIEKNKELGKKLLLTGGGRCNLSHEADPQEFIKAFAKNGKFLYSSLNFFGIDKTLELFTEIGVKTKTDTEQRIYPINLNALQLREKLYKYLNKFGVKMIFNTEIINIKLNKNSISEIILNNKKNFKADKYIICAGASSSPQTGSTGEIFKLLKKIGHNIIEPKPALVPIIIKDPELNKLAGISLKNISIKIFHHNKKILENNGDLLFTHQGLSGPVILNSSYIIQPSMIIEIDFLENNVSLPKKLEKYLLEKKQEKLRLNIDAVGNFQQAMATSGGVNLREVDPKTMQSKIISNLYLAGEVLDLSGVCGGYNLQMCWTTGYTAGAHITK